MKINKRISLIKNIIVKAINNLVPFNIITTNSLPKIVLTRIKFLALNIIINKIIFQFSYFYLNTPLK